jgi:formylglycine-generating enzyme required for sulfatase activity
MGSPPSDPDRQHEDVFHRRRIPRRFLIATKEVPVAEFQRYARETLGGPHAYNTKYSPDPDGPQIDVSWFDAVAFCNWMSKKEKLPQCYRPNNPGKIAGEMRVDADAVAAGGYRLATEAEWEYACRAGTVTARYFGNTLDLLRHYAWSLDTSGFRAQRCGWLLPNEAGLFDMLGNAGEMCHDSRVRYPADRPIIEDSIVSETVSGEPRNIRGGSWAQRPSGLHSGARAWFPPSEHQADIGFRLARTLP